MQINKKSIGALYGKAKSLDQLAAQEKSNKRLMQAIAAYKVLINDYTDQLSSEMFLEVAERCIERMRFVGKNFLKTINKIIFFYINNQILQANTRNQFRSMKY